MISKHQSLFTVMIVGNTLVSKTQGTKIASERLKHRVFEISLADLQGDEDQSYKKLEFKEKKSDLEFKEKMFLPIFGE